MKILVLHAHPVETSFNRALFNAAVEILAAKGHEVDALNLYDENFQAVMSREERLIYHDVAENLSPAIKPYVDRLRAADALVAIYPVWNYGFPAILKGFFDRIFVPGVSFVLVDGKLKTTLDNIKHAVFITSYGGDRFRTMLMGDPPRRIVKRWGWATFKTLLPPKYLALYKMDRRSEGELKAFIEKVRRELAKL